MKLLMTADAVGGVWTYALELARALRPHGVELVLAVLGPAPGEAQYADAAALRNVSLRVGGHRLEWMPEPWADVERAGRWLLELAERERVDLVHLNGYAHAALPWGRPCVVVAHSCVTTWWQSVHGTAPPGEWDEYRGRVSRGLDAADAVVAPTRAFLERLVAAYGARPNAVVIHNSRRADAFHWSPFERRASLVFACGRLWDEAKQMRALDAAMAGLPWPAFVAGATHGPTATFVPERLQCLGALPTRELARWLARASIFVHPARYEPFGLAPLEAALAGCALVLADLPELRELWDGAAAFVDPTDVGALRATLRTLIDDPARRVALAAAAQRRACRYDADAMGRAYLDLYGPLLARDADRELAIA